MTIFFLLCLVVASIALLNVLNCSNAQNNNETKKKLDKKSKISLKHAKKMESFINLRLFIEMLIIFNCHKL